jgi:hypothetical protein
MLRRFASVMAGGVLALTSYAVMAGAPASAGAIREIPHNKIKVTKVVEGTNKGVGYEVVVDCKEPRMLTFAGAELFMGNQGPKELTFGPDGGTKWVEAPPGSICTVIETHSGGATRTVVEGSPCDFSFKDGDVPKLDADATFIPEPPPPCEVTVTNIFDPKPAPLPGPPGPPGPEGPAGAAGAAGVSATTQASAAQAVVGTARFTG